MLRKNRREMWEVLRLDMVDKSAGLSNPTLGWMFVIGQSGQAFLSQREAPSESCCWHIQQPPHGMILHPIVRSLLLRRLPPNRRPESDYIRTHTRLRAHFHQQAHEQAERSQGKGDGPAWLEEVYHELALGDAEPAIELGIAAQRSNLALWPLLLETVTHPLEKRPGSTSTYTRPTLPALPDATAFPQV